MVSEWKRGRRVGWREERLLAAATSARRRAWTLALPMVCRTAAEACIRAQALLGCGFIEVFYVVAMTTGGRAEASLLQREQAFAHHGDLLFGWAAAERPSARKLSARRAVFVGLFFFSVVEVHCGGGRARRSAVDV